MHYYDLYKAIENFVQQRPAILMIQPHPRVGFTLIHNFGAEDRLEKVPERTCSETLKRGCGKRLPVHPGIPVIVSTNCTITFALTTRDARYACWDLR